MATAPPHRALDRRTDRNPARPADAAASRRPLPEGVRPGAAYHVANTLSYVFNPLVLPPVSFGLILAHFGAAGAEIAAVVGVALLFFCIVPLVHLVRMVRRGEAGSVEVRNRERRLKPFLFGIGSYAVGILAIWAVGRTAVPFLVALALIYPVNTALLLLINLRTKISVHMASMAGFVSILLFVATTVFRALPAAAEAFLTALTVAPLLAIVPVLMWARVRVGAHTPGQVAGGAAFGLAVPFVELWLITRALGLV